MPNQVSYEKTSGQNPSNASAHVRPDGDIVVKNTPTKAPYRIENDNGRILVMTSHSTWASYVDSVPTNVGIWLYQGDKIEITL